MRKNLHWLIYPLFILACAKQTAPTGGPKDTIPPILIAATPENGDVMIKNRHIELTFDEHVALNNPKDQIIITPDVQKKFSIIAKKKKVIMDFENDLQDSTTYSLNFRESIQDITEKNSAPNLKLAFSTGTFIDSLSFSGSVYDPLTNKEVKDATVALYQSDTFNIFKHKPVYLSKTNPKGLFSIENLKPGIYYTYAFDDKNKNLVVDSKSEIYGFKKDSMVLKNNVDQLRVPLVKLDARPLKLTNARPYNSYFNIKFTKSIKDYQILSATDSIFSVLAEDKSNVKIYNTFPDKDSLMVNIKATDSLLQQVDTTVYVKFLTRETTPEKFNLSIKEMSASEQRSTITGTITINKPVAAINYDSITYQLDSINIIPFDKTNVVVNNEKGIIKINKTLEKNFFTKNKSAQPAPSPTLTRSKPAKPNQLFKLGKGFIITVENDTSASTQQTLVPVKAEESGIIMVNVTTTEPHFLVQIVNRNFEIVQQKNNQLKTTFSDLPPGDYQIRLVIDTDQDGSWSAGNFYQRKEPEPVIYYRSEKNLQSINLKANWEVGPLLIKY